MSAVSSSMDSASIPRRRLTIFGFFCCPLRGRRAARTDRTDPADPADGLMAAETERLIQEAIGSLDDEHRTVVVLRDIQHCDYREIADILDVPPGTVKSRLHRARLLLRERLKPLLAC